MEKKFLTIRQFQATKSGKRLCLGVKTIRQVLLNWYTEEIKIGASGSHLFEPQYFIRAYRLRHLEKRKRILDGQKRAAAKRRIKGRPWAVKRQAQAITAADELFFKSWSKSKAKKWKIKKINGRFWSNGYVIKKVDGRYVVNGMDLSDFYFGSPEIISQSQADYASLVSRIGKINDYYDRLKVELVEQIDPGTI